MYKEIFGKLLADKKFLRGMSPGVRMSTSRAEEIREHIAEAESLIPHLNEENAFALKEAISRLKIEQMLHD